MDPSERPRPRVGPFLTLRGTGDFQGFRWSYYCDLKDDGIYDYIYVDDAVGRTGGQGGGGHGAPEPERINDRTGRILSTGSLDSGQGLPKPGQRLEPNAVHGIVLGPVARVRVDLSDGSFEEAAMMSCTENSNVQFFVLVFSSGLEPKRIVALDAEGNPVDKSPR